MIEVPLSNSDKVALISNEDIDLLCLYTWSLQTRGYAQSKINGKNCLLHILVGERIGLKGQVDHIDTHKLNSQRLNLRSATGSQNCANRPCNHNNKLGLKGVCWAPNVQRYNATCKGKNLGYFPTKRLASDVRDIFALQIYGEFVHLNNYQGDD